MSDLRQHSEACVRNREPILNELREHLADAHHVWEIGSGTGQHAVYFAAHLPHLTWQPSDRPQYHGSIEAWRTDAALPNLRPVLAFDLFDEAPAVEHTDAIIACNVIHIAPFEATDRVFAHARASLNPGGKILLYGPFIHEDRELEPSNQSFDAMLRQRDPQSGIRRLADVDAKARACGFERALTRRLPANNDLLVYERPL
ncbi:DUF938 domain-containing protein [Lujinxingia vulgaris]|uniref:DUF938 domain-containing protein n=1 Tax=Lujinxingia vulgaris TaxID=2600176 RepID=UPI001E41650A|nr:DUF938 domain-containing protein [Lujinxingia vulgaris]